MKSLTVTAFFFVVTITTVKSISDIHSNTYKVESNSSHGNGTGNDSHHGEEEEHEGIEVAGIHFENVRDQLVFTIVILLAGLSKVGFHHANFLSSKVPESCLLIIVGVILGAIIRFSGAVEHLPEFFSPNAFFQFLLPPIILEASFSLHDRTFANNLGSILLFAVVGTIFACFSIGLTLYGLAKAGAMGYVSPELTFIRILVFTSLIVAVDPVAVLAVFQEVGVNDCLYFLVFGESLLNDGVTVVLYQVMQTYNRLDVIGADQIVLGIVKFFVVCFGGLGLGILAGVLSAVITRFTTHVKVVQPLVIYTMAYLGFLLAELFEFSGIISIIGCGLTQVQYAFHNISPKSKTTVKYFTKVLSTTNEIIIFLFLGLALVREHFWHVGFLLWTVFLCLFYRFVITFALTLCINKLDKYRVRKIGYDEQFMIAYGGLRGAVAFSLVMLLDKNEIPMKDMFVTTTLVVIMFTVFLQGVSIKPLVRVLQIQLAPVKGELSMYRELANHVTDHMMAGMEDLVGFKGKYSLKEKLQNFQDKYLRHLLQVEPGKSDTQLQAFYNKIVLKEHFKYLRVCGAKTVPSEASIPHIDTEMYLSRLDPKPPGEEEEQEESLIPTDQDTEPVVRRRQKFKKDIDARGLRHLLQSQRTSRMLLHSKYDKNITGESGRSFANQIQRKTVKNRRLQRMFSSSTSEATLERTKSWSEQEAQICETRKDLPDQAKKPVRSKTVDLGNTNRMGVAISSTPLPLDSVFEEDEERGIKTEKKPLLHTDEGRGGASAEASPSARRAHCIERQMAMDEVPMQNLKKNSNP